MVVVDAVRAGSIYVAAYLAESMRGSEPSLLMYYTRYGMRFYSIRYLVLLYLGRRRRSTSREWGRKLTSWEMRNFFHKYVKPSEWWERV